VDVRLPLTSQTQDIIVIVLALLAMLIAAYVLWRSNGRSWLAVAVILLALVPVVRRL